MNQSIPTESELIEIVHDWFDSYGYSISACQLFNNRYNSRYHEFDVIVRIKNVRTLAKFCNTVRSKECKITPYIFTAFSPPRIQLDIFGVPRLAQDSPSIVLNYKTFKVSITLIL